MKAKAFAIILYKPPSGQSPADILEQLLDGYPAKSGNAEDGGACKHHRRAAEPDAWLRPDESPGIILGTWF